MIISKIKSKFKIELENQYIIYKWYFPNTNTNYSYIYAVPSTLKNIVINNGRIPLFYLYRGDSINAQWDKITLGDKVSKGIYFPFV